MSKLTAAIIEDEVPAARLLSSIITRLRPDWEVTVLPGSVEEAIIWFRTHSHPDILFLDIQLSDGNSFDFLSAAQPSSLIIFTTAYDQYAIRAFTVNSIDYILKPVDEKRLLDAIVKYETLKGKDYFRLPLLHSSLTVSKAVPELSPGFSLLTCHTTYAPFTPSNSG